MCTHSMYINIYKRRQEHVIDQENFTVKYKMADNAILEMKIIKAPGLSLMSTDKNLKLDT